MASTTFVDKVTQTSADWFNDVDAVVYDVFNSAETAAEARTAISVDSSAEVTAKDAAILADLASTDSGKGANLVAKVKYVYNVKDYGAIGDGTADDYAAIQAAIDACSASTYGGWVYFPAGVYKTLTTLTITSGKVNLCGDGKSIRIYTQSLGAYQGSAVIYNGTTAATYAIAFDIGAINSEGYANCTIRDMTIACGAANTNGLHITGAVAIDIINCQIVADRSWYDAATAENIAVSFDDGIVCTIDRCDIRNWKYGIVAVELFNENVIQRCNIEYILSHAMIVLNRVGSANCRWSFRNNNVFNVANGVLLCGASRVALIEGNTFENIGGYAVRLQKEDFFNTGTIYGVPETARIRDNFVYNVQANPTNHGVFEIMALADNCEIEGNRANGGHGDLIYVNATDFDTGAMVYEWNNVNVSHPVYSSSSSLNQLGHLQFRRQADTAAASDTTPSVANGLSVLFVNNGSATTITQLDDGYNGQMVTIYAQQGNTTIEHGTNFLLSGSTDFVMALQDSLTVVLAGGVWIEVGRKV